jgi:glycosyltransferase involved in cell wall biosynthesis
MANNSRGLRILDIGDDYFHPTSGGGWAWDWYFPVTEALAEFERLGPVDAFRFWGRLAPSPAPPGEVKFPFPSGTVIAVTGAKASGARGGREHLRVLPQVLTRGISEVLRADVVLFRWPAVHSMLLLLVAVAIRKPFVLRLRTDVESGWRAVGNVGAFGGRLVRAYTRWALRRATVPVVISDFLNARYADGRAHVLNECGVMERDVAPAVPEQPAGKTILYVGRVAPEKGVDVLVRAFALLDDADARLRIVGGGPERERIEALTRELGVAPRVEFAGGIVDRDVLREEYRRATLFALPSRTEGLGCVLLEAMAAATPIVATSAGGIPDLVTHGENGLLAPPDDPAALAAALRRMLADQELRARCAARGLEIVRHHTFERQTRRWAELAVAAARRAV